MSKAPGPGVCIHCLREVETRNWDHVLPTSWYPDSTPTNMEKWKAPSCMDCNKQYGNLERELLITIGMCLNSDDPEISSIVKKALRSINPSDAKDRKDKRERKRASDKIRKKLIKLKDVPKESVFPNFGPRIDAEGYAGLPVPREGLEKMAEKIVRGIVFKETGQFIGDGYDIEIYVLHDEDAKQFVDMVSKFGGEINRGVGLSVIRAVLPEDPKTGVYAITIWKQLKMYAVVSPHNLEELAEEAKKKRHSDASGTDA